MTTPPRCWRGAGAGLPAHGAPPGGGGVRGRPAFDHLYEAAATFEEVYAGIVEALVAAALEAAPEPVVYAVPGSPLVAERTVELLRADGRVEVTVAAGSLLPGPGLGGAGHRPSGRGGAAGRRRRLRAGRGRQGGPFLVAQCWSRHLLSEVKLALPDDEGRERPGRAPAPPRARGRGGGGGRLVGARPHAGARPSHLALRSRASPAPAAVAAGREVAGLVDLMATLRERCPWDSVQTHASLMPHLVEESYEVLDALAGARPS